MMTLELLLICLGGPVGAFAIIWIATVRDRREFRRTLQQRIDDLGE